MEELILVTNSSGGGISGTIDASYYKGQGIRQGIEREFIVLRRKNQMAKAKVGDKIRINYMDGEPDYSGREGIVKRIDDIGQLHGTWGGLAVSCDVDDFEVIEPNE